MEKLSGKKVCTKLHVCDHFVRSVQVSVTFCMVPNLKDNCSETSGSRAQGVTQEQQTLHWKSKTLQDPGLE